MKKGKLIVSIAVCAVLLVSCGNGGAPTSEHSGEYADALSLADASFTAVSIDSALSEDELKLISHLVSCEVGEFPYETQVCFAAMVLNRIADPGFPVSARGVVFDSGDFKSVLSGRVTGTLPPGCTVSRKYQTALKAVNEALNGSDPTNGALYFARSDSSVSYADLSYECGGMTFGK